MFSLEFSFAQREKKMRMKRMKKMKMKKRKMRRKTRKIKIQTPWMKALMVTLSCQDLLFLV
jgi:hypothetical protein